MSKRRIFWGLFFIVGAVFLIVSKIGFMGDINILSVLLTIFFVAGLIESIVHKNISGVLFSIAFLCIIYAKRLGIEAIVPWPVLGAALLGSIGCSFLFRPKWHCKGGHKHFSESIETVDDPQMDFNTTFSGTIKYVKSDDFQSAKIKCSFGSIKVYFDDSVISQDKAVISLDISFAGAELYIPKEWDVVNNVCCSFGGIDEKNKNNSTGTPKLIMTGKVSFAGVEIIYI